MERRRRTVRSGLATQEHTEKKNQDQDESELIWPEKQQKISVCSSVLQSMILQPRRDVRNKKNSLRFARKAPRFTPRVKQTRRYRK